jgi:hypothetical protein
MVWEGTIRGGLVLYERVNSVVARFLKGSNFFLKKSIPAKKIQDFTPELLVSMVLHPP